MALEAALQRPGALQERCVAPDCSARERCRSVAWPRKPVGAGSSRCKRLQETKPTLLNLAGVKVVGPGKQQLQHNWSVAAALRGLEFRSIIKQELQHLGALQLQEGRGYL